MMQELEHFAQSWHELGYHDIALCVQDFLSPDKELREKAYYVLIDSDIALDLRSASQELYIKFLFYLLKESAYERLSHLQLIHQSSVSHYLWSQGEKDKFEKLFADHIDYLEQFLDEPEYKYYIFGIYSNLPRYRERLAPILLNSKDEKEIMPFYLSDLMVKPISNTEAYIDYFNKHLSSDSEKIRKVAEEALVKLLADENK